MPITGETVDWNEDAVQIVLLSFGCHKDLLARIQDACHEMAKWRRKPQAIIDCVSTRLQFGRPLR